MAEKKNDPAPTARPSAEQMAEWKAKYKKVHEITTEDGFVAVVREPSMVDLEIAMDKSTKKGARYFDFNRTLYRRCKLWEQEGMMDDEDRALELLSAMGSLGEIREATIKKL